MKQCIHTVTRNQKILITHFDSKLSISRPKHLPELCTTKGNFTLLFLYLGTGGGLVGTRLALLSAYSWLYTQGPHLAVLRNIQGAWD